MTAKGSISACHGISNGQLFLEPSSSCKWRERSVSAKWLLTPLSRIMPMVLERACLFLVEWVGVHVVGVYNMEVLRDQRWFEGKHLIYYFFSSHWSIPSWLCDWLDGPPHCPDDGSGSLLYTWAFPNQMIVPLWRNNTSLLESTHAVGKLCSRKKPKLFLQTSEANEQQNQNSWCTSNALHDNLLNAFNFCLHGVTTAILWFYIRSFWIFGGGECGCLK